jgi:hypothetical protein
VSSDPGLGGRLRSLHPGYKLVLVVVVGYLLFLGFGAATAPPLVPEAEDPVTTPGTDTPTNGTTDAGTGTPTPAYGQRDTLVGLQGSFRDYGGYARLISGDDNSVAWEGNESWANFDVTPLSDGRVLTAFIDKNPTETGFRIYDVENDTLNREWTFPVGRTHNSEVHDIEMLPSGEVLVVDMVAERVFAVDESGEITWQWNASEWYTPPDDPGSRDWLHMNDVDRIGEDRYLVSVRNANQLVVLERGGGVVDVINEDDGGSDTTCLENGQGNQNRLVPGADGDVPCGDTDVFSEQHNPQWLGNGRVLVADSENDRVVEVWNRSGEWEVVWELDSANGIGFRWPRDVDLLENGNYLITDSLNNRVVEVTRDGETVWGVRPGDIPYEADRMNGGEYPRSVFDPDVSNGDGTTPVGTLPSPGDGGSDTNEIPLISFAFSALKGSFPSLIPYWVNQWHLLGFVLTLPTAAVGFVWAYRDR